jgi:uncharacterized protein YegJ (DUF2314 family)
MKKIAKSTIALLLTVILNLTSCHNSESTKLERENEPDMFRVEEEDPKMTAAILSAKNTLNRFDSALKSQNEKFSEFALKQQFETIDGGEHIWIGDIYIIDGNYYGFLANQPDKIPGLNIGDSLKIDKEKISDWKYQIGNKIIGGFTIRLLRDNYSEEEKKQFDEEYGLDFE